MKKKLSFTLTAVLLICALLLTACAPAADTAAELTPTPKPAATPQQGVEATATPAPEPKVLNWVASGEVTTQDSGKSYDVISAEQIDFHADPLYLINEDNEVIPNLAVALPVVSDDGLTLTLSIRDDAAYSNGEKITAADIVYAAQRVVDPETGSQSANNLTFIKNAKEIIEGTLPVDQLGVRALSDTELEFTLVAPNNFVNFELSSTLLAPVNRAFAEAQGDQYALSSENLLASGPFVLTGWRGGSTSWKYVKNPYYWDADNIYFDEINIQIVKEVSTGVNLYEAGELDATAITGEYISLYRGTEDLVSVQTLRMTNLELGISANKYLQNINLRKRF